MKEGEEKYFSVKLLPTIRKTARQSIAFSSRIQTSDGHTLKYFYIKNISDLISWAVYLSMKINVSVTFLVRQTIFIKFIYLTFMLLFNTQEPKVSLNKHSKLKVVW